MEPLGCHARCAPSAPLQARHGAGDPLRLLGAALVCINLLALPLLCGVLLAEQWRFAARRRRAAAATAGAATGPWELAGLLNAMASD